MSDLSITSKKIILLIVAFALILGGLGFLLYGKTFLFGILYGSFFSIIRLVLLEKTLASALYKSPNKAKSSATANYFVRLIITALALIVAIYNDNISTTGAIIGLLLMNLSAYLSPFFIKDSDFDIDKSKIIKFEDDEEEVTTETIMDMFK